MRPFFFLLTVALFFGLFGFCITAKANTATPTPIDTIVDDIRIDSVVYTINKNTTEVSLRMTSLKKQPREFKLNTFGTQLIDKNENPYFFSSISMGRVLLRFEDKQNYLHHLLHPDIPVTLSISAQKLLSDTDAIKTLKLVFEHGEEKGLFVEVLLHDVKQLVN